MDISTTTANRRGYVSAQQQRQQQWQQYYLISYNLVSAILWTAVLGRVLLLIPLVGFQHVYGGVGDFTKWTQTLAVAEVVHSALGSFWFFVLKNIRICICMRIYIYIYTCACACLPLPPPLSLPSHPLHIYTKRGKERENRPSSPPQQKQIYNRREKRIHQNHTKALTANIPLSKV